jgi:hypothetical protein
MLPVAKVAWDERPESERRTIQKAICTPEDGIWGPQTYRALIDWGVHKAASPVDGRLASPSTVETLTALAGNPAELATYCETRNAFATGEAPGVTNFVARQFQGLSLTGLNGATISVSTSTVVDGKVAISLVVEPQATVETPALSVVTALISKAELPASFGQPNLTIANLNEIKGALRSN